MERAALAASRRARPRAAVSAARRVAAFLPLAVLMALALLFVGYALHHDPRVEPAALVGHAAPRTPLPTLDGGPPEAPGAGGPVLVNFFASWCVPCAQEAPALDALQAQGVRLTGVAYKDDPVETRRFLAERGDPFARVLMDRGGRAGVDWGVSGVPETFLVAADGRVLAKHSGPLAPADADALLAAAARARPPAG